MSAASSKSRPEGRGQRAEEAAKLTPHPSPLTPGVPWGPWLAIAFVVAVYFVSQIVGGFVVSIYPALKHWSKVNTTFWLNTSVWAQFFYMLFALSFMVAALWWFLRRAKTSWQAIGLRKLRWTDPLAGLAMLVPYFITYLIVVGIAAQLFPHLNVNQEQQLGFNNVAGAGELVVTFISLVILPPIVEELLARGFLYTSLKSRWPKLGAVLVTSIIFASGHLQIGSGAPLLWIAFIDTFVLSLFLVLLREITDGLYASMTLHGLKNFIAFFALFIVHVH